MCAGRGAFRGTFDAAKGALGTLSDPVDLFGEVYGRPLASRPPAAVNGTFTTSAV
jgi:hypothetical protein